MGSLSLRIHLYHAFPCFLPRATTLYNYYSIPSFSQIYSFV